MACSNCTILLEKVEIHLAYIYVHNRVKVFRPTATQKLESAISNLSILEVELLKVKGSSINCFRECHCQHSKIHVKKKAIQCGTGSVFNEVTGHLSFICSDGHQTVVVHVHNGFHSDRKVGCVHIKSKR